MAKKQRKTGRESDKDNGSDMTKFYVILGAVAVLGVGAIGYTVGSTALGSAVTAPVEVEGLDSAQRVMELAQGITKGDPNATISIIEFGDYQCPGCAQFAGVVEPQVIAAFVETGQAKFVYYDFPLISIHPNSFLASRASRCAQDQERYWEYHELLYRKQGEWSPLSNPVGKLMDYAEELGLDEDDFESCLKSDQHAATVTANMRLGEMLGVSGTPTVIVGQGQGMPRRVGRNTFEAIRDAVQELQNLDGGR